MRGTTRAVAIGAAVGLALLTVPPVSAATDRATTDRAATARASCADATLLFCEDFEALPVGAGTGARWSADTAQGTLSVAAGDAERGGQVLDVRTDGNGRAFLSVDGFTAPDNSHFGRMYVKVDAFPTAPDWAHFTLVEATGSAPGGEIVRPFGGQYAPTNNGAFVGVGADGGPTGDWTNWRESAPAVAGAWQCVEWEIQAVDNRVTLWLNGVDNPELTVSTRQHGGNPVDFVLPAIDRVKLGWQLYQGNPTPAGYHVQLDDVALSTSRLGCGQ